MEQFLYVYGINVALAVLKNSRIQVKSIYLSVDKISNRMKEILSLSEAQNIIVKKVNKKELDILSKKSTHQNILLEISNYHYYSLSELITLNKTTKNPFFLMLDQITDPYNFGALIRSADMLGINGIIIASNRQVALTPVVSKASSGGFAYVPICQVSNLTQAIMMLKEQGYWVYGTGLKQDSVSITSLKYDTPIVVILGNEGQGISQKLLHHCDFNIFLPTSGHLDSLNVSVAGALIIYQIKQLQQ